MTKNISTRITTASHFTPRSRRENKKTEYKQNGVKMSMQPIGNGRRFNADSTTSFPLYLAATERVMMTQRMNWEMIRMMNWKNWKNSMTMMMMMMNWMRKNWKKSSTMNCCCCCCYHCRCPAQVRIYECYTDNRNVNRPYSYPLESPHHKRIHNLALCTSFHRHTFPNTVPNLSTMSIAHTDTDPNMEMALHPQSHHWRKTNIHSASLLQMSGHRIHVR